MIKMTAFSVQEEEIPIFEKYKAAYGIDLILIDGKISVKKIQALENFDVVNVLSGAVLTDEIWDALKSKGVKIGITRTIGIEHMNQEYAAKLGIKVMNITYSPSSVADYAIMMMLMVLRHIKPVMQRYIAQDFTSTPFRGRELPNLTVGIIGAGPIAQTLAKHLCGFGCRLLYWNRREKPEMQGHAEFCQLNDLLAQSDIVSIHLALCPETTHFFDAVKIAKMKDGSILLNTSRGPIVENQALIHALENGHLSGAGLDVFDGDRTIYYREYKNKVLANHEMAILNSMPNVLMLPHLAYFTDQALHDMVHNSLKVIAEAWEN